MKIWFTSDTHFGHTNIIKYCRRPFYSIGEMNDALISRWNERVTPEDFVYHLGDFSMGRPEETLLLGARLHGHKTLLLGNHDRASRRMREDAGFERVEKMLEETFNGFRVRLQHHPVGTEYFGNYDYRFCGHIHEKWKSRGSEINVGVDAWDFRPHTFEELTWGIPPQTSRQPPRPVASSPT